jgi:hypothetical protein
MSGKPPTISFEEERAYDLGRRAGLTHAARIASSLAHTEASSLPEMLFALHIARRLRRLGKTLPLPPSPRPTDLAACPHQNQQLSHKA